MRDFFKSQRRRAHAEECERQKRERDDIVVRLDVLEQTHQIQMRVIQEALLKLSTHIEMLEHRFTNVVLELQKYNLEITNKLYRMHDNIEDMCKWHSDHPRKIDK